MGLLVLGFGPVSYLFIFYIRSQYGNAQYNSVSLRAYPLSFDVCLHVAHLFVSRPLHSGRLMDNLSFSSIWLRKSRVWFVYIFYVSLWCGLWYVFLYCDVDVYVFKYLLIVFFSGYGIKRLNRSCLALPFPRWYVSRFLLVVV